MEKTQNFVEYQQTCLTAHGKVVQATGAACWHCTFSFDGPPKMVPVRYVQIKNTWTTVGAFCSWSCAKAWQQIRAPYNTPIQRMWLVQLAKQNFGYDKNIIHPAPDPWILKRFGGTLTIQEFRSLSGSEPCETLHPPLLPACMAIVHGSVLGATRKISATRNDKAATTKTEDGHDTSQKGLYEKFLNKSQDKNTPTPESRCPPVLEKKSTKKKPGRKKTNVRGSLSNFMKRND